jgi:hypothetical protein
MNSRTHGLRPSGMRRHAMTQSTVDLRMPIDRYPSDPEASKSDGAPASVAPIKNDTDSREESERDTKV